MVLFINLFDLSRWQKVASYLSADLVEPVDLDSCIDHRELWRGSLVIREKKVWILDSGKVCRVGVFFRKQSGLRLFLHDWFHKLHPMRDWDEADVKM